MAHKTLLVVYHTMTGGTEQMAQAAAEGARDESGVHVRLLRAPQAQPEDVLSADGYLFATPENLAAIAGLMKDFFDRCYYAALDRVNGRPYALLVCAGSDGQNATSCSRSSAATARRAGFSWPRTGDPVGGPQ